MEPDRPVGLNEERRDMPHVYRLVDMQDLLVLIQTFQNGTETLRHGPPPGVGSLWPDTGGVKRAQTAGKG